MAVESGERWNGWLGLTHCLIYPQCPCEHSGEIHYLTSSITSHGQGKRPAFHTDTHPRDRLRRLTQWGRGSRRNVVTHREQKCLRWGMGCLRGAVQGVEHRQHIAATRDHMHMHLTAMEIDAFAISHTDTVALLLFCGWMVKR